MPIKGTCSEIFGEWIFFKLSDMVTFPNKTSSMVKKLQICMSFACYFEKNNVAVTYKMWKPRFLIFKRGIFADFSLTTPTLRIQFHIKPSKLKICPHSKSVEVRSRASDSQKKIFILVQVLLIHSFVSRAFCTAFI